MGGRWGGKITRKKMLTSQMPSQTESVKEVSSNTDNGKVFKIRGKIGNGLTNGWTDVENPHYSLKTRNLRLRNFFF